MDDQNENMKTEGLMNEKDEGSDVVCCMNEHEEVNVIYLDVQGSEGPQVLDISSFIIPEDIQIIDTGTSTHHMNQDQEIIVCHEGILHKGASHAPICTSPSTKSEVQSADALLHLSRTQADNDTCFIPVSDILTAHRLTQEDQNASSAEALLQLSSDHNSGTVIVDENGSMIRLEQVSTSNLVDIDDTGATSIAICQCCCGREFISEKDLAKHKLAHKYQSTQPRSGSTMNKCLLCPETFNPTQDICLHQNELYREDDSPWECNVCSRKFYKKLALKAHMRVHNTLTRYQCSTCKKTALNRHLKMHTCEKPFKCTICGDLYQTLWDLRKHRLNHQPTRLYKCDICTKVFKQKQTLLVHSRLHSGHRPYSCDVCNRTFSLKTTLVQHQRIHTGEKPNVCPSCHRAFRQNSTLKAHMRTHTNQKPYICRYCKLRFAYKDELHEHEHSHAQNKNWQCDRCGMWFKNQSLLLRHCRVHTNERPFQCNICQKTFVQSGSLQAHMRSHTKEKPYQCRMCAKSYYTSGTLLIHIRKAHNVDAKSVKEVFPVMKCIEDQKVFTVRNKSLINTQPVSTEPAIKKEVSEVSEEEILLKESLAEWFLQKYQSDTETVQIEVQQSDMETVQIEVQQIEVDCSDPILDRASIESKDQCLQPSLEQVDNITFKIEQEALSPSHTAQDRQEAALGLAELSLSGESLAGEKPPKTRTFFKEEEEDENDPSVTKIILSKEGGIMNSQDPHQCPVCGRIFGRKSIMIEHLRIHTDEKPYQCDFCTSGFRQNAQLRSHIRNKHTKVERYQCSFCHKRFLSRNITIRHINFHHKLKVKYCESIDSNWSINSAVWSDDNFELNTSDTVFVKANTNRGEQPFKLESTASGENVNETKNNKTTSPSSDKHTQEKRMRSNEGSLQSDRDLKCTNTDQQSTIHGKLSSTDLSKLKCPSCGIQFTTLSCLEEHFLKVHKTKLDKSTLHGEVSESNHEVKLEITSSPAAAVHSGKSVMNIIVLEDAQVCADDPLNMPHSCIMCTLRYTNKADLHEHMKAHGEEDVERVGMHRCDTCFFVMKNTQQVAKHILKFHGVQQIFMCSICCREFYQQSSVYRHMRFFHKWEIKIRGEANIPVLVKPATPTVDGEKKLEILITTNTAEHSDKETDALGKINHESEELDTHTIYNQARQVIQIFQNVQAMQAANVKTEAVNEDHCMFYVMEETGTLSDKDSLCVKEKLKDNSIGSVELNQLITLDNRTWLESNSKENTLKSESSVSTPVHPKSQHKTSSDCTGPIIMSVKDIFPKDKTISSNVHKKQPQSKKRVSILHPSPGDSGSHPSPGDSGSHPSPGDSGSHPSPGDSGSLTNFSLLVSSPPDTSHTDITGNTSSTPVTVDGDNYRGKCVTSADPTTKQRVHNGLKHQTGKQGLGKKEELKQKLKTECHEHENQESLTSNFKKCQTAQNIGRAVGQQDKMLKTANSSVKNSKVVNADLDSSVAQNTVLRSSSGRIIKRKQFDDEIIKSK